MSHTTYTHNIYDVSKSSQRYRVVRPITSKQCELDPSRAGGNWSLTVSILLDETKVIAIVRANRTVSMGSHLHLGKTRWILRSCGGWLFVLLLHIVAMDRAMAWRSMLRQSRHYCYRTWSTTMQTALDPIYSSMDFLSSSIPAVDILEQTEHYLVVNKPPAVLCHHSPWAGKTRETEVPMLQRLRAHLQRRVNLVHRLDRGASGCLLGTFADDDNMDYHSNATALLSAALQNNATKTYIALVRGEGILHGSDWKERGWFLVDRPIRDERGRERTAATWLRFVAGQDNGAGTLERARASLVLARPLTGRWHQIRKHLNGVSHPILGDSTHGSSSLNREWKERRGLPAARTCLHLSRLQIGPVPGVCPNGIDVRCPLAPDLLQLLQNQLPKVLAEAEPILKEEGIIL